jgi:hypothetical protein
MTNVVDIKKYRDQKLLKEAKDKKVVIEFPTLRVTLKDGKWVLRDPPTK